MGYSTALPYYASHSQAQMHYRPIETRIVRKVIRALKAAGTPVTAVFDGEEKTPVRTEQEAMVEVFGLDMAWLMTEWGSWVVIVIGNRWEAISDYTLDLEAALAEVEAWIAKNQDED